MIVYNITFVVEDSALERFLSWMRQGVLGKLRKDAGANSSLAVVTEVMGQPDIKDMARSVAFRAEFDHVAQAKAWAEDTIPEVEAEFMEKFGPVAMSVATIMETVDEKI